MGSILIWLCVSKKKGKEGSQAVNEGSKPLEGIYEDPDTVNFQPSFAQEIEVTTADNVAYSTQLQVLPDKDVTTADNVAYSTQLQVLQDKGVKTQDNLAYGVASTIT